MAASKRPSSMSDDARSGGDIHASSSPDSSTQAEAESGPSSSKRVRLSTPPPRSPKQPPSLHSWLHPDAAPLFHVHSPALHASSSTFLAFAIAFEPPAHISSIESLSKEVRRIVRELDVPSLVGDVVMKGSEGAFQNGEGRRKIKGKDRAREPDHRMWAVRGVVLKEGCDGTKGEGDYQLLEAFNDDGEKFGGERVLRVLKEHNGVDVISVCCRWYGGDMLGPIRFQHIGLTVQTSLQDLQKQVRLRDLRAALDALDDDISAMRSILNPSEMKASSTDKSGATRDNAALHDQSRDSPADDSPKVSPYENIVDAEKLRRLVGAREKTKAALEQKTAWVAMEQAKSSTPQDI